MTKKALETPAETKKRKHDLVVYNDFHRLKTPDIKTTAVMRVIRQKHGHCKGTVYTILERVKERQRKQKELEEQKKQQD